MPSDCNNTSVGVTYGAKFANELAPCAGAVVGGQMDPSVCPWFRTPDKPSSSAGAGMGLPVRASGAPKIRLLAGNCRLAGSTLSCDGLLDRP